MYTLCLDHNDALDASASNYRAATLQPQNDFPISITRSGVVLSRYGDDVWDLSPYSPNTRRLRFLKRDEGPNPAVSNANVELHKRIAFWTLYALGVRSSASSIYVMFYLARCLTQICSESGVLLSEMYRFPKLIEKLGATVPSSQRHALRRLIYRMVRDTDLLGFTILTTEQIDSVVERVGRHRPVRQTLFIPERIYLSIVDRCVDVLRGFLAHEAQFRALYKECAELYAIYLRKSANGKTKPRKYSNNRMLTVLEELAGQSFESMAMSYGVWEEMKRSYEMPRHEQPSIRHFGYYLRGVKFVARLLISALTGMRRAEVANLRVGCLKVRDDPIIGKTFLIYGPTTKTLQSKNAAWVTAPEAELAVSAATTIVELQNIALALDPRRSAKFEQQLLFGRRADLWSGIHAPQGLVELADEITAPWPGAASQTGVRIFSRSDLNITQEDLDQARRMNPILPASVVVGDQWPLSWHQFRRTIICLALGAGVSLPAIAWQAKHSCTAMSLHYGQNYFNIDAGPGLSTEFKLAEVEMFLLRSSELHEERFVSPTGNKAKVVQIMGRNDFKMMSKLAGQGKSTYRRTLLGYCTNLAPCPHGGWDNITNCVACDFALLDSAKYRSLIAFRQGIELEIAECLQKDALLKDSLVAQLEAVKRAIKAIS